MVSLPDSGTPPDRDPAAATRAQLPPACEEVLGSAGDAVVAIDGEERVTYWGRGAEQLYGVPAQRAVGRPIRELLSWRWTSPEAERLARESLDRSGRWRGELEHLLRSGRAIQVETTLAVLRDGEGRACGLLALTRDVSERVRVEREHEATETRLRVALGLIDMAVFSQDRDLRYSWVYRPQLAAADDILGRTDYEFLPRLTVSGFEEVIAVKLRALESGAPVRKEIRLVEQDGVHWYDLAVHPTRGAAGQVVGLTAASLEITDRKRREEEVRTSREQLRALAIRLQSVREEENARIARDLHDELGQLLTALQMHLRPVERGLESVGAGSEALLDHVVAAADLANQTIASVQRLALELRPGTLDRLGLAAALRDEARRFQQRTGIRCDAQVAPELPSLSRDAATALYRICQEAMTNVCRHAEAAQVQLRIHPDARGVRLEIEDDGRGLDPAGIGDRPALGLLGMAERARALGGSVELRAAGERGTIVSAWVPVAGASPVAGTP